ncbi:hypothetical protein N9164_03880, partial [Draconibacterium sp.]|nr:hypothetical protein [Draconibacterium sp.]
MKLIKLVSFPLELLFTITFLGTFFQSCEPDDCEDKNVVPCDTCIRVLKPNIYIYPEEEILLSVSLDFPQGGEVIASIPDYGNGWDVNVETSGRIDGKYDYLFYESNQPDVWQMEKGWCLKKENLAEFFTNNLTVYGFEGQEIENFIEYWGPRFNTANYYLIYPQTNTLIDNVIELNFSEKPDNVLRLFYLVKEIDIDISEDLEIPE